MLRSPLKVWERVSTLVACARGREAARRAEASGVEWSRAELSGAERSGPSRASLFFSAEANELQPRSWDASSCSLNFGPLWELKRWNMQGRKLV